MRGRFIRGKGFTLVEVLVALLVLAIGLLGVAGTQILAMQQVSNANLRSQATLHAQNVAERVRALGGALSAGEMDLIEAQLARDLGSNASIEVSVDGGVAEIEISWEEADPFAASKRSTQTLTLQARLS